MTEIIGSKNNKSYEQVKKELFLELQRREIITDYLPCALWEYNIEEKCQYQYKKLNGKWMENKEPVRKFRESILQWGLIHPDDISVFGKYCDSLDNGESDFSYDMRLLNDDNKFIWINYSGKAVFDENGKAVSVLGITTDVTSRHSNINKQKNNIDAITGMLGRNCLDLMQVQFDSVKAAGNFCMILIDIDDFRYINDNYGKSYGDWLLKQIGELIDLRFGKNTIAGRLGGDQFAVFYYDFTDFLAVKNQISLFQQAVENNSFDKNINVTVSIGAANTVLEENGGFQSLLHNAETALYIVKHGVVNSCYYFTENDRYAMPPDCRQIKFSERYIEKTPMYLSKTINNEKKLFDFAFQTLNSNSDFYSAALSVFGKFGRQYGIDTISLSHKYAAGSAEVPIMWNSIGGNSVPDGYDNYIDKYWDKISSLVSCENQMMICDDVSLLADNSFFSEEEYKADTLSYIVCGIFEDRNMIGFISLDYSSHLHTWTDEELSVFSSMTRLVATYMIRFLSRKDLITESAYSAAILENKKILGYTVNPETYEITYATHHFLDIFGGASMGSVCYRQIMGNSKPCSNCPIRYLENDVKNYTVELYSRKRNTWFSSTATEIDSAKGKEEYMVCLTDITQFMDRVQSRDRLTGLLTFDKFEIECVKTLDAVPEQFFAVVIKVVRFGEINDDFGFDVGNRVIKEIASKFARSITEEELVCRSTAAHFFALFKSDVSWKVENRLIAIFKSIEDSVRLIEPDLKLCMAAGVYQITPEDNQFNSCLDKANYALKKITGKKFVNQNRILTYNTALHKELTARREIEHNMFKALKDGEFRVYYQPKVSLENGEIYGAEALVRWIKPDGKIISPGVFVPIFEENEFITEMDFYVYEAVMHDMQTLIDEGIKLPIISLNVSRQHFSGNDFPDKFCRLVNKYNIPHKNIELELTETAFLGNVDRMINIVKLLRNRRGFRISVDDFGSGYSSLNLISVLPVDVLKIDGKFFMANEMSTRNKKVIETILQLANTLNFDTVSEGVETKEQIEFLKHTNCNAVQGYFYYQPMPFSEFKNLIKK